MGVVETAEDLDTIYIRCESAGQKYVLASHLTPWPLSLGRGEPDANLLLEIEVVVVGAAGVEGGLAMRAGTIAA